MEREFFTVQEVHELTGLHPNTIRKRIKDGTFKTMQRSSQGKGSEPYLILRESIYDRGSQKLLP